MTPSLSASRPIAPTALSLPLIALLALVPTTFWRGALGTFEVTKVAILQLAALGAVALWRGPVIARPRCPIVAAVLLGCVSAALSTVFSASPRLSWQGAWESHAGLTTVLALAVVFFAARASSGCRARAWGLIAAVVVGTVPACAYAVVQAAGADPLAWDDLSPWRGWSRPMGTLGHPNHLGGLAAICVPLLLALLARSQHDRGARRALGVCLVVALVTVVASLSRAAWLAAGVGGGAWLALRLRCSFPGRRAALGGVAAGCALLVALLAGWRGPLGERVRTGGEMASRLLIWRAALDAFGERPALGSGLDTFAIAFAHHRPTGYAEVEWGVTPLRAHNDFLHVLATQGALGGAALLLLLFGLARTGWCAYREREDDRPLVVAAGAALLAWIVLGLFGFTVVTTAAVAAALAGVVAGLGQAPETERGVPGGAVVAAAALIGWLVLLANLVLDTTPGKGLAAGALLLWQGAAVLLALRATRGSFAAGEAATPRLGRRWAVVGLVILLAGGVVARPLLAACASQWGERRSEAESALRWHARAAALAPEYTIYHLKHARRAQEAAEGDVPSPEAARAYRARASAGACRAVELDCASGDHWANHARALQAQALAGEADGAAVVAAYEQAVRRDPHNLHYLAEATRAAFRFGRVDIGYALAERALRLAPTMAAFHVELANGALAARQLADAEAHLTRALGGDWRSDWEARDRCWSLLGLVWLEAGRPADAERAAAEVLARQPAWSPVRWVRARALERMGRGVEALAQYEEALRHQPGFAPALEGRRRLTGRP